MKREEMWGYIWRMIQSAPLLTSHLKDQIEDEMDGLWAKMSAEEIEYVNEIAAKLANDL